MAKSGAKRRWSSLPILSVLTALIVGGGVYALVLYGESIKVPAPERDTASEFSVPRPDAPSVLSIPVSADLSGALAQALAEVENPVSSGTEIINVPTNLQIEQLSIRTVQEEVTRMEEQVREVHRQVCRREREQCTEFETITGQVCEEAPWPLNEICNEVEEQVCVATETVCAAFKDVVRERIVEVPVQVLEEVEEEYLEVVDNITDLDAEVEHTVNFVDADISLDGDRVTGWADVEYQIKLNANLGGLEGQVQLAELNGIASCGYDEPMRRMRLHLNARLDTRPGPAIKLRDPEWRIEWTDPCELTAFDVRLEDLIGLPFIEDEVTGKIDEAVLDKIADVNEGLLFRDQVAEVWPLISEPRELAEGAWLTTNPESLSLAPITGSSKTVFSTISLTARPVVSFDEPDAPASSPPPRVRVASPESGLRINVGAGMNYDQITAKLNEILAGQDLSPAKVAGLELYSSQGRLVVSVELTEPVQGKVYLLATPVLSPETNRITFPELDYTVESLNALVQAADVPVHERLRDWMRESFVLEYEEVKNDMLQQYREWDVELANGVSLSVQAEDVSLTDFQITASGIYAVAHISGSASIHVDM